MDNKIKNIIIVLFIFVVLYLLQVLESILLPLFLAFFSASLFNPIIQLFKKIKIPNFITITFIVIFSTAIIFGVFLIVQDTFYEMSAESDYISEQLTEKTNATFKWINQTFGAKLSFKRVYKQMIAQMDTEWVSSRASIALSTLSSFTGAVTMYFLYFIVILSGMANYKRFLSYVDNFNPDGKVIYFYERIQKALSSYIIVKSLINLIMAAITYGLCLLFGVKFALFWGFITFIFSFIPTIGSVISTAFPVLMALIQNDTFQPALIFLAILVGVHFIIGNALEPVVMGSSMQINTLTVIFGLVLWGHIWGISGMMLSVPLLVVFKIVFEQFPELQIYSRIMGIPEKSK
jgi:predicted PurR-regulated permease PerM